MELKSLNTFIEIAAQKPNKKIAVAAADDKPVLEAIKNASNNGIVDPILIGNTDAIKKIAQEIEFDLSNVELIEEASAPKACLKSVSLVRDGHAHILMKGLVGTADFLRAILNKEKGLRTSSLLSHVGFFESPSYPKLLALTDAAQNIQPSLEEKVKIIQNCVDLYHRIGIENPKIALIGAVETVNPKMPATTDAAIITMMNRRGQIRGCTIDGPLAFDIAISKEAAEHKKIVSDVAGHTDLLFVPNIEVGNVLYKSFTYYAGASAAAILLGAAAPIVLTSRADSDRSKMLSIALAASC